MLSITIIRIIVTVIVNRIIQVVLLLLAILFLRLELQLQATAYSYVIIRRVLSRSFHLKMVGSAQNSACSLAKPLITLFLMFNNEICRLYALLPHTYMYVCIYICIYMYTIYLK